MALNKKGIDYYPRDVGMMRDRKFNRLRQKFGYIVYVIYDALLEMIYGDKGYYLIYNENTKDEVIWELQDYCRGKYGVDEATICNVIEMLTECGLFSGERFKQGIITSRRIQEVYYRTTVERKNVAVDRNIWILDLEEMQSISSKSSILQTFERSGTDPGASEDKREDINENGEIINENKEIREESKVNESKVNKNKVNESKKEGNINIDNNIKKAYRECFLEVLDVEGEAGKMIKEWLKYFESDLICEAMRITRAKGKTSIGYTRGILKKWYNEGLKDHIEYLFNEDMK